MGRVTDIIINNYFRCQDIKYILIYLIEILNGPLYIYLI